jgi:hypothetical protein
MATLEQIKELLGELPKDVQERPYQAKEFLHWMNAVIADEGEDYIKENALAYLSA